jgi:thiol-disulfide isomerase/thioredoxin
VPNGGLAYQGQETSSGEYRVNLQIWTASAEEQGMRMKGILALGLVLVGSLIEARASWLTSFDTAKNEAAAKGRPILMNFTGSDWCPACKQIAPVLRSSEFLAFAGDNVVLVEIDFPRYRAQAALEQQANRVLINSETFSVGESASLKLGDNKVRVQCLEIGEKSVTVRIEGESAPRTLLLSDIRR